MSLAIQIEALTVSYGSKMILRNVYLDIQAGQIYGILGPNGAGKSTLFKAILELIEPNRGEIKVFGESLDDVRNRVAYIPQKDEVDWSFPATVQDVVLMGRYPYKKFYQVINKKDRAIADRVMDQIGISHLRSRQIGQLSGGQQQRVFIARALAQEADIMFLDEPFVGVDATTEAHIMDLLRSQAAEGKTFLMIHHDLSKVDEYFDQIVLLNKRIAAVGPSSTTFTEENIKRTYGPQSKLLDID